jgi:hypothetical protein
MLHMADGSWKLADWSAGTTTLCRDRPGEDVNSVIIVSTNTGTAPLGNFIHTLRVAPNCPFPKHLTGTWTRTYRIPSEGTWTEVLNGTSTYVRNPLFPPETDGTSQVPYELESGSVTYEVSGDWNPGNCPTTFSGSGSFVPLSQRDGGGSSMGLENVTGKDGAPKPEPKPFYYSLRSSGVAETPQYNITNCDGTTQSQIVDPWIDIGHNGPLMADTPQEGIQKSADPRLLEGHAGPKDDGTGIVVEDSWSFKGSD